MTAMGDVITTPLDNISVGSKHVPILTVWSFFYPNKTSHRAYINHFLPVNYCGYNKRCGPTPNPIFVIHHFIRFFVECSGVYHRGH